MGSMPIQSWIERISGTTGARGPFASRAAGALLFVAGYVALDWASYIYPLGPFNITPWNPPPALSIVWMMLGGLGYAPVVFVAAFVSDVVIRHAPGGLWVTALTSLVLAVGYAAIAGALRPIFESDPRLRDTRRLWIFVAVTASGAAAVALLYVGVLLATGFISGSSFADAAIRFWLGDAVGVLVTAPLLLVAADPEARVRLARSWRKPETFLQFAVMTGALYYIFEVAGDPSKFFYGLFLPLIWIALRGGLGAAALASAIVQAGVVLGARGGVMHSLAVVELQALVAALTLTGLFLGVMVDERARAGESLKQSLRLAAAGEMAGTIAHELNQPLAALANYGRACQLLLERGGDAGSRFGIAETIEKMLGESKRASDVVSRLRDFFRTGTTRLQETTVETLLEGALRIGRDLNRSGDVELNVEGGGAGRALLVDRLQIELVLRNLLANALEAVAHEPPGKKRVTVSAESTDGRVIFRVRDSGPGVSAAARGHLFEPFSTSKPSGMGLGLAISRAIAEAHGGSLEVAQTARGEFYLMLPVKGPDE
jgi:two-component system sensor kinase FixL